MNSIKIFLKGEILVKFKDQVLAFIPARGNSKSIPFKNMVNLNGRPLINYVIKSGKASRSVSRIICSTENEQIKGFCKACGIEVQDRPKALAEDNASTQDVIIYFLETLLKTEGIIGDIIVLLEPTSPFVLPRHIDDCVKLLKSNQSADSVQSITLVHPNHHAYNQRYLEGDRVYFRFPEERKKFYNKQLKPKFYVHGNLRVFRSETILKKRDIYGSLSLHYIIPGIYAIDVDGPEDLKLAECILKCNMVELP
jgi:CMP-N,N'-diacetyllegionaminic acid synthase